MARAYWHMGRGGGLAIDAVLDVIYPEIRIVEWDEKSSNVKKMEAVALRVDSIIGLPKSQDREVLREWQRSILSSKNLRAVIKTHGDVIDWGDPYLYRKIAGDSRQKDQALEDLVKAELVKIRAALADARK